MLLIVSRMVDALRKPTLLPHVRQEIQRARGQVYWTGKPPGSALEPGSARLLGMRTPLSVMIAGICV